MSLGCAIATLILPSTRRPPHSDVLSPATAQRLSVRLGGSEPPFGSIGRQLSPCGHLWHARPCRRSSARCSARASFYISTSPGAAPLRAQTTCRCFQNDSRLLKNSSSSAGFLTLRKPRDTQGFASLVPRPHRIRRSRETLNTYKGRSNVRDPRSKARQPSWTRFFRDDYRFASNCKTRVVDTGGGKDQVDMHREWRLLGLRYLRLHPNCKPEPSPSRVSCNPRRVHSTLRLRQYTLRASPIWTRLPPLNLFYPSRQVFRGGSSCVGRCGGLGRDAIRPHV